jgi:D-glycero-D-manno-heptose 1,7-bisphosphate phosphatase
MAHTHGARRTEAAVTRGAIFLDRDGVLNANRADYVKRWDEVRFLDGVFDAMRALAATERPIFVITNQSAVGRGILSLADAEALNARIVAEVVAHGGRVDGSYLCPHRPDAGCECRKPAPGMLLQAAREHGVDLRSSFVVGDAMSDMGAAGAVGAHGILVRTGRGAGEAAAHCCEAAGDVEVVADLSAAADLIIRAIGMASV